MEPDAGSTIIGSFHVGVDPQRAADFARETGLVLRSGDVPFCYPVVWMAEPSIHAAILQECKHDNSVPFHESQNFAYVTPLSLAESYELFVTMRREAAPARLIVDATLKALDGALCGRIETMMRLVQRSDLTPAVSGEASA
jgi:hypothetical protein